MLVSDPVDVTLPSLAELVVDVYLPGDTAASTSPLTTHSAALQTNYVSAAGNHAGAVDLPVATTTTAWFFLARVEVSTPEPSAAAVLLGDSITDGARSTVDANSRWPDHLAKRLAAQPRTVKMGVLNAGIGGNRLLTDGAGTSALARFDRDVLVQTGVTHVIVMEGINDIGRLEPHVTTDDLIAAHKQFIQRARARGLKIYGATLTPFAGTTIPKYFSESGEAMRQALNQWIRTGGAYDGVVDFDALLRDPQDPSKMLAKYDSGDHLHPNDAGYQAMAEAVDLSWFK